MPTELQSLLATPESAALGPGPRSGVKDETSIRAAVAKVRTSDSKRAERAEGHDGLLALMLLWHDHHEASHEIAQAIDNADGSYVHAILHRREPDYGNARYWFRRVGQHPAHAELGRRVAELLRDRGAAKLAAALVPGGRWDPMAFVDACEAAGGGTGDAVLLREIQRIEFAVLAEYLL